MKSSVILLALLLWACGGPAAPASSPAPAIDEARCQRGALEPDLRATAGGASDTLPPGHYVFSATYLKLSSTRPAQQKFRDLMRPMEETLQHAEGLVGYRVATSSDCVTARTLSVWKDEQAMKRFVYSPAHGKAIAAISELSRGGSVTTRWEGESADFSLETAARKLSAAPPLD